ncbi:MAG: hypothetical protein ACYTGB_16100 [Planctomycetota bacterium]|jgi:hypothetical protein
MGEPDLREQLQAVQRGLRRAGREMVLSGTQALVRGVLVSAGCALSYPLLGRHWWQMNALWAGVVVTVVAVEAVLYRRLVSRSPEKYVTGIERQMLKFFALILCLGTAVSIALLRGGRAEMVPGMWTILAGIAYVAVGLFSFSGTWVLGLAACVAGAAGLFLGPEWSFLLLGVSLGLGSIAWGLAVKFRERAGS